MKKYALVIGIENYPEASGQCRVPCAINDCKAMASYFTAAGFGTEAPLLDEEAITHEIFAALERLFYHVEPEDGIAIFYAGHGYYTEMGGYILPYYYRKDMPVNDATCVPYDWIDKYVRKKQPADFLLFLDTCRSGSAVDQLGFRKGACGARDLVRVSPGIESQLEQIVAAPGRKKNLGRVIFTSCAPTEQ